GGSSGRGRGRVSQSWGRPRTNSSVRAAELPAVGRRVPRLSGEPGRVSGRPRENHREHRSEEQCPLYVAYCECEVTACPSWLTSSSSPRKRPSFPDFVISGACSSPSHFLYTTFFTFLLLGIGGNF